MIVIKEKRGRLGVREREGEDRMGSRAKVDRRGDQDRRGVVGEGRQD